MTINNVRKYVPPTVLRRMLTQKLANRKIKFTPMLLAFMIESYHSYAKKLSKLARLSAISEKSRQINSKHLIDAHETIMQKTKVKRKQRTLDEMLHRRSHK